jgi:hypothetical protein
VKKELLVVESVIGFMNDIKGTKCHENIIKLLTQLSEGNEPQHYKFDDTKYFYIEQCLDGVDITIYFNDTDDNSYKILDIMTNAEVCA